MLTSRSLALGILLAATACGGSSGTSATTPAPSPCTALPSADPSATMPTGMPPIAGQVLYEPSSQGKTHIVFGLAKGGFVRVRDDYVTALRAAGWTIDGTDQESVEAEAQFSKNPPLRTGTVKVQPLCDGYVTVRFKLNE